ncbi:MAG: isoprenylcysteine carboxylmethyltransferase family protein [Luteimonas sp.]|nr:isoprenylcysteine carboxylmethyltransferase family protein [Luteimonas sp.]
MGSDGARGAPSRAVPAPAWIRATAPLYCILAFAAGAGLQHLLGLPLPPARLHGAMHVAGTVLANAGLALVLWCFVLFAWRRTTILPGSAPARLVRGGPYRFSRNPIYLSLVLAYAGLALMQDLPWALLLLPLPVAVMHFAIIPFEERQLRLRFGADYADYAARVRRWL